MDTHSQRPGFVVQRFPSSPGCRCPRCLHLMFNSAESSGKLHVARSICINQFDFRTLENAVLFQNSNPVSMVGHLVQRGTIFHLMKAAFKN